MVPATSMVASNRPSFCWKAGAGSPVVGPSCGVARVAHDFGPSRGMPAGETPCVLISARSSLPRVLWWLPVEEVDAQAEDQPDKEPQPVGRRQGEHQQQTAEDAQDRHDRHERAAEGPRRLGLVFRMMSTAPQTMTKANRVPMLVRCSRASMGRKPARRPTKRPMRMVLFQGVWNRGWTSAKKPWAPIRRGPWPGTRAGR